MSKYQTNDNRRSLRRSTRIYAKPATVTFEPDDSLQDNEYEQQPPEDEQQLNETKRLMDEAFGPESTEFQREPRPTNELGGKGKENDPDDQVNRDAEGARGRSQNPQTGQAREDTREEMVLDSPPERDDKGGANDSTESRPKSPSPGPQGGDDSTRTAQGRAPSPALPPVPQQGAEDVEHESVRLRVYETRKPHGDQIALRVSQLSKVRHQFARSADRIMMYYARHHNRTIYKVPYRSHYMQMMLKSIQYFDRLIEETYVNQRTHTHSEIDKEYACYVLPIDH